MHCGKTLQDSPALGHDTHLLLAGSHQYPVYWPQSVAEVAVAPGVQEPPPPTNAWQVGVVPKQTVPPPHRSLVVLQLAPAESNALQIGLAPE